MLLSAAMALPPQPFKVSGLSTLFLLSAILNRLAAASPTSSNHLSHRDAPITSLKAHSHHYNPGVGAKPPQDMNNKAYFALFALLGAAMVLTSIWFFFWARNGGFIWRRNDWDDYKSTVLRRKGKDGKTLSNATPATDLGEKSIAGTFDVERDNDHIFQVNDYGRRHNYGNRNAARNANRPGARRQPSDADLRAYRHEKSARVGGLNREQDGSHFDYSSTEPSEVVSNNSRVHLRPGSSGSGAGMYASPKRGFMDKKRARKEEKRAEKKAKQDRKIDKKAAAAARKKLNNTRRHPFAADNASDAGVAAPTYRRQGPSPTAPADDAAGLYFASSRTPAPARRHEASRPSAAAAAAARARQRSSTSASPPRAAAPQNPRVPGSFDAYSDAGSSDTGTKVYEHRIPGLSRGARNSGFRRERPGRRDSLADSEYGDLGAARRP